jgi:hypothetical protein
MKIKVRKSVFETNSSSVHSITMCSKSIYDEWIRGDRVYDRDNHELILIDNIDIEYERYGYKQYLTYEEFNDYDYIDYERFSESYITESGDEVVAFGYHGDN